MRSAEPPTDDDVTVLLDGRRLDSRESVQAWLKEVEALRVLEAAARDAAQ
jgi:DNA polymerase III delta subunit